MPPELFGPLGLLVALSLAVAALWRDHVRADQDDRDQRDRWQAIAEKLVADAERRRRATDEP